MSVHTQQLKIEIKLNKLATEIETMYQEVEAIGQWLHDPGNNPDTPEQHKERYDKSNQLSGLHYKIDKKLAVLGSYVLEARELKLARLLLFSEGT